MKMKNFGDAIAFTFDFILSMNHVSTYVQFLFIIPCMLYNLYFIYWMCSGSFFRTSIKKKNLKVSILWITTFFFNVISFHWIFIQQSCWLVQQSFFYIWDGTLLFFFYLLLLYFFFSFDEVKQLNQQESVFLVSKINFEPNW